MAINLSSGITSAEAASAFDKDFAAKKFNVESGVYDAIVKNVYFTPSPNNPKSNAANVVVAIGDVTLTLQHWVTYKDSGLTYKVVDGKKVLMPGMKVLNSLTYVALGKVAEQCTIEPRTVKIFNYKTKQEVPTQVDAIVEMMNQPIRIAIKKVNMYKKELVNGERVPTTTRFITNEVEKYLDTSGRTAQEKADGTQGPVWAMAWSEKNKDKLFEEKIDTSKLINNAVAKEEPVVNEVANLF